MKLIFMGSPEFAVPVLRRLVDTGHEIVAVYCQPPRPAGRGQKETLTPIHALAEQLRLPVHTPVSLKDPVEQQEFAMHGADIAVVVAYGLLLPEPILKACRYGCINIHPSLLPRWRGAAPIHRPILAGDRETGVTIMQMDKGLDTGDMIATETVKLTKDTTYSNLHDALAQIGAELLVETLEHIGTLSRTPQPTEGATYAAKLTKEEGNIDWSSSAEDIDRKIRAFTPWPGAWFTYQGEVFKITEARYTMHSHNHIAGTVLDDTLTIACGEGMLMPKIMQRQGKKALEVGEFLRGFPLPVGTRL